MKISKFKKSIAGFFVATVLLSQSLFALNYVVQPKPAQAFLGIGDITFSFSTEVGNFYDIVKDIGLAAAKRVAKSYIDKYLAKFVDQLLDKYKIRNYLYYARLLDAYYLNQYIADKIEEPELRQIYLLLSSQVRINIYSTSEAEKRKQKQFLQERREVLAERHASLGGVSTQNFLAPDPSLNSVEKFELGISYFSNAPEFTEANIVADFTASQASAQQAAGLEISQGDGLKNERTTQEKVTNGMRIVQTAISNPASFAQNMAQSAVDKLFDNAADANNIWSTVGSLLGDFIFRKLDVERTGSGTVINEYAPDDIITPVISAGVRIDLDNDGYPDGEDVDGDGLLDSPEDICFHGGVPGVGSGCFKSINVGSSAFFTPLCQALDKAVAGLNNFLDFMERNENLLRPNGADFKDDADADIWGRRAQTANSDVDNLLRVIDQYRNPNLDRMEIAVGRFSSYMNEMIQSLFQDRDMDLGGWFSNGEGGLRAYIFESRRMVSYLEESRAQIGKCEDPDLDAVGSITPPDIDYPGEEGTCTPPSNARGNDAGAPTTAPNINDIVIRDALDVRGWQQTSTLSSVMADNSFITTTYDKGGTWPAVDLADPGAPSALTVANPWILVWRSGAWQATTYSWLRPNQYGKGIDEVWCGGINGGVTLGDFIPKAGETYGFMVTMVARIPELAAEQAALNGGVQERTNIVMYTWPAGIDIDRDDDDDDDDNNPHVCSDKGGFANHASALQAGINAINTSNPNGVADLLNTHEGAMAYLTALASQIRTTGFNATVNVLNGNGNPNRGDLIAIWRSTDTTMERYDAVVAVGDGNRPMREAITSGQFTGDIPLICVF